MTSIEQEEYAKNLDAKYPGFKGQFEYPTLKSLGVEGASDEPGIYFCGNSLGLMPKTTRKAVAQELDAWALRGVNSHFDHPYSEPWVSIDDPVTVLVAPIVGANDISEVAIMNSLTANLHAMIAAFYKPTEKRFKILYEKKAFPSDTYAFINQAKLHNLEPESALITIGARDGEYTIRTEDVLEIIEKQGDEISLVLLSGIQFYTGQLFDIPAITKAAQAKGIICGWDLAHAVGNVPLKLHDWGVDFAVFCTYKYLNAGPGSIGGIFVHSKHAKDERPRLAGWWGNNPATRFQMEDRFDPIPGAQGFRMSNPSVLNTVCLGESLKLFAKVGGVPELYKRSLSMTNYLIELLTKSKFYVPVNDAGPEDKAHFKILTPLDSRQRGAQVSVLFLPSGKGIMDKVFKHLSDKGIVTDERKPDALRITPNHFYNTHLEVLRVVKTLEDALERLSL